MEHSIEQYSRHFIGVYQTLAQNSFIQNKLRLISSIALLSFCFALREHDFLTALLHIFILGRYRNGHYYYLNIITGPAGLSRVNINSCRFMVAEWLTHWPATLDVTGLRPNSGDVSEIYFLESIVSSAEGLEMVCVTL